MASAINLMFKPACQATTVEEFISTGELLKNWVACEPYGY